MNLAAEGEKARVSMPQRASALLHPPTRSDHWPKRAEELPNRMSQTMRLKG
jgi:hypothetical protein